MAEKEQKQQTNRVPVTLRDFFWHDPFFSDSWKEFDAIRESMLKESSDFWEKFNLAPTTPTDIMPPRTNWMFSRLLSTDQTKDLTPAELLSRKKDESTLKIKDDKDKFEVSLDTHQYRPDELKVNVEKNILTIEGKHEEKSEDGSKFVSQQFYRSYALPKGCEADKVVSNLSSDGILMITAPKTPQIESSARNIPIDNK